MTKRLPTSNLKHSHKLETKRRSSRNDEQDRVFFLALTQAFSIARAAEKAGYSHASVHNWLRREPSFKEAFEEAYKAGTDALRDEARRRAYAGVNRPVFHKGAVCGHIREYSDPLLMFIMKSREPETYRENYNISGEVEHHHTHELILRNANERALKMVTELRQLPEQTP